MSRKQDLRSALEQLLGRPVTDLSFVTLCEEIAGDDYDFESRSDKELQQLADAMKMFYEKMVRSGLFKDAETSRPDAPIEPPEWWVKESNLILESQREFQQEALGLFGLEEPLAINELGAFLKEQVALERAEGDPAEFLYPVPARRDPESFYAVSQLIFRGFNTAEFVTRGGRGRTLPFSASEELNEDVLRQAQKAADWAQTHTQRLWRLYELANEMHRRAGFGVDQAVGFLLCDLRVVRPWINIRPGWFLSGKTERWFFKIDVGTPEVSPEALAAAYGRFLEDFGLRQPVRRTGRDSRSALYEWVNGVREAEPGVNFPELYERWSQASEASELPQGAVSYSNYKSLRSAYNQKDRELKAKGGGRR